MFHQDLSYRKNKVTTWFRHLRDKICNTFQALETQATQDFPDLYGGSQNPRSLGGTFTTTQWERQGGGGGEMRLMYGGLFEKVGVNISTVWGVFSEGFRSHVPDAKDNPTFWASGISLVAHMRNPHIPAIHMNTRFMVTTTQWFGGGIDLTPCLPRKEETDFFHTTLKSFCDRHQQDLYPQHRAWCERYFYLPHRSELRGVGGIFFDNFNRGNWAADFAYTQDVGRSLLPSFVPLVERHMQRGWTMQDREKLLEKRGRYVEFNLLYDRGTMFGLKTGGHTEAILMSLPPEATWKPNNPKNKQ